ncbi:uncharacterized protein LOC132278046 [Cornus florida]|uniref:uncharacterized protein LOC132278046 n=1 Tax=Cornus florida TaxID=4283 RepID=UPI00289D5C4C|nr:uncharacterized protein LOC132278046 [Cornus florida]
MFYAFGLSFNLAKCPHFRKYSLTLANSKLSGYTPPTFDRLQTTLLAQEKAHVNCKLQPIKNTWKKKNMSLCSDGWSDRQRRPLINIMVASVGGAMFLKAVDASGNIKDADYVANLFKLVIQEMGSQNVVQVITDNGNNFKAAGAIIEGIYPHIFWTPCVVHCLNLALKSICEPSENSPQFAECKWIANLVSSVQNIRNFIVNHGMVLSIFNNYSELGLLRVAETRFASSIIMVKRMREVKDALEKMVMDPSWRMHLKWDRKSAIEIKAKEVKISIVSDSWWADFEYLLDFTEPIVEFLRLADTDAPILHLIYDMWDTMIEKVKSRIFGHEKQDLLTGQSNFFDVIHNILETRWNKSNNPLHCMAHSLVPKYYTKAWIGGGSDGVPRLSPHEDQEVSLNRSKCFKRLFSNQDDLRKFISNMELFQVDLVTLMSLMLLMQNCMRNQFHGGLIMVLQHQCYQL